MASTFDKTFKRYFGPTDATSGTGKVTRVDESGCLREVVVNEAEAAEFKAQQEEAAQERASALEKQTELMTRLNE